MASEPTVTQPLSKLDAIARTASRRFQHPALDIVCLLHGFRAFGEPAQALANWCKPGRAVAFLGSSGVGKSTLTNALMGAQAIATQGIREDDAKGRHAKGRQTTTRRALHGTPGGCLVLDTPGMRELQLTDAATGIADLFEDIETLAASCRFTDCRRETEPGCTVQIALEDGSLDPARLARWRRLRAEDAFNSATLCRAPRKGPRLWQAGAQRHQRKIGSKALDAFNMPAPAPASPRSR